MEAIWNRIDLQRPPNTSWRIERNKFDGTAFLMTLDKVIKDLTSQELLHKEAAMLSRLIYRMKTKFRNDKGVKSMCKINKALLNYLLLSLEKEYENLKDYVEIDEKFVTLPSKQMVEYVLIKTQGFAKLMLRIEEVSKYAAHFLKCRIGLGHAWSIAVIAYAVVSRIWILSRHLVKKSCVWYNDLYTYLKLMKVSGVPWLPKEYVLTSDLKSWISIPWIEEPTPSVPSEFGLQNTMFKLILPCEYGSDEDSIVDVQDCNKGGKFRAENEYSFTEKENAVHSLTKNVESQKTTSNDDTGEVINRYTFNSKCTKDAQITVNEEPKNFIKIANTKEKITNGRDSAPINVKKEKHVTASTTTPALKVLPKKVLSFDNAETKSDLLQLLNKESYPGLDKLRWNMIRNKSKKLLNKLETNGTEQSILFRKITKRIKTWIT